MMYLPKSLSVQLLQYIQIVHLRLLIVIALYVAKLHGFNSMEALDNGP